MRKLPVCQVIRTCTSPVFVDPSHPAVLHWFYFVPSWQKSTQKYFVFNSLHKLHTSVKETSKFSSHFWCGSSDLEYSFYSKSCLYLSLERTCTLNRFHHVLLHFNQPKALQSEWLWVICTFFTGRIMMELTHKHPYVETTLMSYVETPDQFRLCRWYEHHKSLIPMTYLLDSFFRRFRRSHRTFLGSLHETATSSSKALILGVFSQTADVDWWFSFHNMLRIFWRILPQNDQTLHVW